MRIAILCDGRTLADWQYRAIEQIAGSHELFLLAVGEQAPPPRQPVRHGLYYLLNLLAIRNRRTRRRPFPDGRIAIARRFDCAAQAEGAWSSLPEPALDWIADQRIDAIVKFGLGLLRVPPPEKLAAPILSYHHGHPARYRGRPAGFYELLNGEPAIGQVVQILGNRLDAGEILAIGESRAVRHSYKSTLCYSFALSPLLLPRALRALAAGERVPLSSIGRNYRLPSNLLVGRFLMGLAMRRARHWLYGAFVEKNWRVSTIDLGQIPCPTGAIAAAAARPSDWQTPAVARQHRFHADPFFLGDGERIVLEAMSGRTGKGELLLVHGERQSVIAGLPGHVSYPLPIEQDGETLIVPETASWSPPAIFTIDGNEARRVADLDVDAPALLDPTLVRHDGRVYLFGNRRDEGPAVLRLWSADDLFGRFVEHPDSPVRLSIRGARMAGGVRRWGDGLYRLGQDFRRGYGDGIIAFRILELDRDRYREEESGSAAFDTVKGPHTLNAAGGRLLFDWYDETVSPLAGVRRLLNRF